MDEPYRHSQTKEGEYPRTAVELLHHSLGTLIEQFPERVIDRRRADGGHIFNMPAYEWSGAGSVRGGSAEHMRYEQVVFLPEREGRVSVVSVGDKQFDSMHTVFIIDDRAGSPTHGDLSEYDVRSGCSPSYYSVLFRFSVSPVFAEALLEYYHAHVQGKEERNYTFSRLFEDVLGDGTRHYMGCPLFAVDPGSGSHRSGNLYVNKYGSISDFTRGCLVEVPVSWRDRLRDDLGRRQELSRSLATYLQGQAVDPSFRDTAFDQAFQGWSHTLMGRTFQSNAYDPRDEEKSLATLQKDAA